jgi:hypothetical protein
MMVHRISQKLRNQVVESVNAAKATHGIVNITTLVDRIAKRSGSQGAEFDELEEMILNLAVQAGCPVEFGRASGIDLIPEDYTMIEIEIVPEQPAEM